MEHLMLHSVRADKGATPHLLQGSSALDFTHCSDLFGQLLSRLFPHWVHWPRHDIRSRACSPPLQHAGAGMAGDIQPGTPIGAAAQGS